MNYKFKRALGISFVLYVATFATGIICGMLSGQDMSSMENIPNSFWYVGMIAALILTFLFSRWYFKSSEIVSSAKGGFMFGLTTVILSSLLDYVLFTFGSPEGAEVNMMDYYGDYRYWIIILLVLVTATIVGSKKASKPDPRIA